MAADRPTAAPTVLNHGNTCERSHPSQTDGSTVVQVAALQAYIAKRDRTQDGFALEFRVSVFEQNMCNLNTVS